MQYRVSKSKNPLEATEKAMPDGDQVQLKTYKLTIACLLEDFVQSNLQFFYVEKFLLEEDTLIYVKSILMVAFYAWYLCQLVMLRGGQ